MAERKRGSTATSNFGVSRRESHDATAFYQRFELPVLSDDDTINPPGIRDRIVLGPASDMSAIADNSVALVVTSPPYYAGKAYEEEIGEGHVPASYLDYLEMLNDVFAECARVLEPGGRIAVNVANLGRRPYRSLSADVTHILQDRLKLLLRGEIIWVKARGAGGNCAWGSFQQPGNPVLRDLSERIVIASKGRFDRALRKEHRAAAGLPSVSTIYRDEFLDFTTDVWEFAPESASRIGHPAPFPTELPARLIDLYTYEEDVVLDPFMGSGTTAVAAIRSNRHYLGFDTDKAYVKLAKQRIAEARSDMAEHAEDPLPVQPTLRTTKPGTTKRDDTTASDGATLAQRAVTEGRKAHDYAHDLLEAAGFGDIVNGVKLPGGVEISFSAVDPKGRPWLFEVVGGFSSSKPGLNRADLLWKTIGKSATVAAHHRRQRNGRSSARLTPLVILTPAAPPQGSAGAKALDLVADGSKDAAIRSVVTLLDPHDLDELRSLHLDR